MRRIKKWLLSACGAIGGLCLVFAGFGFAKNDVQSVKAEEGGLSAYDVYGGSVRLVSDEHGNGVRFHVGMTMENFANYGTIDADGKTGVLNSNYQTGTLLLPAHLLNGKELVKGGTGYNATLSDTDTSELWYKKTVGDVEYMQSVVYLYNIPESDLGTEISVRGYIVDKSTGTPTYTDQLDTISMSAVADMEYYDEASKLTAEQKESLKQTYLDKEVTFHVNGTTEDTRVLYYNTPVSTSEAPATVANAEFVGWYKKDGVTPFDFTAPVKNDTNAYAIYRRDISIENGANVEDYIKDYTYTSVVKAVYTAPTGSTYELASGVGAMDLSTLSDVPQDHGEGTLTVTMKNGDSTFSVPLPVTVVTKYIGTLGDFQTTITNAGVVVDKPVYGYYKLTADIGDATTDWVDGSTAWISGWANKVFGFFGTMNGQGHTVYTASNYYFGLFGTLTNATVKNMTVVDRWLGGGDASVLAHVIKGSTIENLTVKAINNSGARNSHAWFGGGEVSSSTFRNVTVQSKSVLSIDGLFGTSFFGEASDSRVCTFENFVVENMTITRLGSHAYWGHAYVDASVGDGQTQTISSVDYTTAVVKGVVVKANTASATVSGTQEVVLSAENNAISLGDGYEDADIISVTLGGYSLGTDLSKLEIPQNMISDGAVFGNQTVTVLANVNGVATTISVPVSVSQVEMTKVALDTMQDLVMTDDTFSITLGDQYKTAKIQSILLDGNDLGTTLSALNISDTIKTDTQNHGEKEILVSATYKGAPYQFTVPVTLVTEEITSLDRIWELRPKANNTALYGYYKLANDVGSSTYTWVTGTSAPDTSGSSDGWRATLDGNGYSISYKSAYNCRGLFGEIGNGAVIKDITFNDYGYASDYAHSGLSRNIKDATFTDVVYNVCSRVNNANYRTSGVLANNGFSGNTFTNVVINAQGLTIDSIFGQSFSAESCTFTNCYVYASTLSELGNTSTDYTVNAFPAETAVTSVDGITVATAPTNTNVTLQGTQDIVLSKAINALDLGAYAGLEVNSITLTMGGTNYDLGTDASALNIPTEAVDAKDKHGKATVTVVCVDSLSLSTTTVTINVLVVTKDITTTDEFVEAFAMPTASTAYYGYYRLANDIGDSTFVFTNTFEENSWRTYGFRGTFDGNNKTITGKTGTRGMFGYINEGAVIKNVTINDKWYSGSTYTAVLATSICRATIENVTVNHQGGTPTTETADRRGYLTYEAVYGSTFKNVTVNAEGKDLPSIFGGYTYWGYERYNNASTTEENSFENVVIIANAIGEIGHCSGYASGDTTVTKVTSETGITISLPTVKVTLSAQDVLVSSPSLDLGAYAGMTIASIKSLDGATDYGTNAGALQNVTAGETTLVVSGTLNDQSHEITVPVTFVDGIITTMEELETAVRYYGTNKSGYYVLGKDVSYTESGFAWDKSASRAWDQVSGFNGTLDGRGHSITVQSGDNNYQYGLFGTMNGTIKNLTINATNAVAYSKGIIATICCGTVENVTINIYDGKNATYPYANQAVGALVESAMYASTKNVWTNVKVNVDCAMNALFPATANMKATFTNCELNAPSFTSFTLGEGKKSLSGWVNVRSLTEREVWIDTDKTLDLGEYAGLTVNSIKTANGEYDFGTNANALTIPSGITTGRTTLIVMATDTATGINYKITVPVNFCSFEEATSIEITDTTEQAIDLGITAGTVNNDQTYTIALDGLSKYNFVSATINGKTFNDMTFNVNVFGKTFGTTEMTITYLCSGENKTITVPAVLATKVLKTADDINNWTAWADAYDGTTGDWKYDGYFVLGNDIEYNATFETLKYGQADATGKPIEVASGQEELGFRGTFDGRGYAIKNMRVSDTFNGNRYYSSTAPHTFEKNEMDKGTHYRFTAFITKMHANGVLRNVAFDGGVADYNAYLVGWGDGLVENVYVKYTQTNAVDSQYVVTINNGATYGKVTMKNAIIDITEHQFNFQHATNKYFLIGQANDTYNLYQNVFIVGEMTDQMVGVRYQNTDLGTGEDGSIPRGYDYFVNYSTVSEFLAYHADQVNGWNYFHVDAGEVWMNGDALMTATNTATKPDTKYFVNASRTATDYVIVYDERNDSAREAAGFIGEMFYRATGTVAYGVNSDSPGTFTEYVTGGVLLPRATTATWSEDACYIVIGDVKGMPVSEALSGENTTNTYVIKSYGNHSVFIYAQDENDYLAAAYNFLEEALGFQAYDDDVVAFNYSGDVTFDGSRFDIVVESAFSVRSQTGATNPYKNAQRTMNGQDFWSMGPTAVDRTTDEERVWGVHNTMYWLPYETYGSTYAGWYRSAVSRTYTKPDGTSGTYNAYDICYTAGGSSTADDTSVYDAMVSTLAGKMVDVLNANPDKTALTFSMMDDYSMDPCTCSGCSAISTSNNTAAALKFLSDVATAIEEALPSRDFELYTLAYYYLLNAPKAEELTEAGLSDGINEHVGVLYAPVRVADESLGLKANTKNQAVYDDMVAWSNLTDNVALWFYDTIYHNYMMPIDTFESMINWLAYAVEIFGTDVAWVTVNGQSRQYTQTAFESFKNFVVHRAEIEVYEKVVKGGIGITDAKIKAYLAELEGEFFGFTVNNDVKTFHDGAYYGTATANEAMYNMYSWMRSYYQGKRDDGSTKAYEGNGASFGWSSDTTDMTGNTSEAYDYMKYGILGNSATYKTWLADNNTTRCYFVNFTTDEINKYMGYLETAMASVNGLSEDNSMKKVYQQKVLIESLFPRFVICNGNHSNYWSGGFNHGGSYWTGDLSSARTAFKADCTSLGVTYYAEHGAMSDVFTKWDV